MVFFLVPWGASEDSYFLMWHYLVSSLLLCCRYRYCSLPLKKRQKNSQIGEIPFLCSVDWQMFTVLHKKATSGLCSFVLCLFFWHFCQLGIKNFFVSHVKVMLLLSRWRQCEVQNFVVANLACVFLIKTPCINPVCIHFWRCFEYFVPKFKFKATAAAQVATQGWNFFFLYTRVLLCEEKERKTSTGRENLSAENWPLLKMGLPKETKYHYLPDLFHFQSISFQKSL